MPATESVLSLTERTFPRGRSAKRLDSTRLLTESRSGSMSSVAELPNRLLTALQVAEFVGCHEETVRRAYLGGLLKRQRFGARGWRFHPGDVADWLERGAPTRRY